MDEIQRYWAEFLAWFGPNKYLQAAVIVAVSLLGARLVDLVVTRLLKRLSRHTQTDFDDRVIEVCHRPLFQMVVLTGLGVATLRLELPPRVEWLTVSIIKTFAVFVVVGLAIRLTTILLGVFSRRGDSQVVQARTLPLFENVGRVVLIAGAIYFIFLSWDIDVTAWLASAGIVGIAIGFAAKDTLANLFSGVFILADAPYNLGDFVVLDSGERGMVTHIGIRSTRLLTRDDIEITIPNAVMGNAKITNETGGPYTKARVRIPVGVAYGSDVDQVRRVLVDLAGDEPNVVDDPEPRVRFRTFGNSSLDFELLVWIAEPVLRGRVKDALNTAIYKRFAVDGIEIPFPKRDVYIRDWPSGQPGPPRDD